MRRRDTEPIEGSASPRNPRVVTALEVVQSGDFAGGVAADR